MMRKIAMVLPSIMLIFNFSSYADGGFYIGLGVGYASFSNSSSNNFTFGGSGSSAQTTGSVASTLYFGYDLNHYFGIQGEYNVAYWSQVNNSYQFNQQLLGVSLLGHLPLGFIADSLSSLSIYAKVGVDSGILNFYNVNSCTNCVNPPPTYAQYIPEYGVGLEYGIYNWGFRLEWDGVGSTTTYYQGNSQVGITPNMFFLSALYHF